MPGVMTRLVDPGSPFSHSSRIHQTGHTTISTVETGESRRHEMPMRKGEPGWFYIGNGLLQYKDINGWTDQYQDLDSPAKSSDVGPLASTDVLGSGIGEVGRGARDPWLLTRLCSSASHLLIVGLSRLMVAFGLRLIAGFRRLTAERCRQASASLSIRSVARRQHDPSKSSVLVDRPIGLMKRSSSEHPRREIIRHQSRFHLSPGQSEEEEADFFIDLDPERLKDLNPNVAGVDQRVPFPGKGIGAKPLVCG